MNIAQTRKHDIANGPGIRLTIFVSGCTHNCKECFNEEYQDFNYGKALDDKLLNEILDMSKDEHITGISILGGEPMQQNPDEMIKLLDALKKASVNKPIWLWSGYTFDEILKLSGSKEILKYIDVLIDGRFIISKKDVRLKYCGSTNQRVIDVKKSLENSNVVIYDI